MIFDTIFNEGLDEDLCTIRDLTSYSAGKLKQEEFKIVRYKIEYILFKFEEYMKNLPPPGIALSPRNRIQIYNIRHILEGLSVVFNMQINYIKKLYSNYMKHREKQLVSDPYNRAEIMKPKRKTGKTRKFLHISKVIDTHESEIPVLRDIINGSSFFDVGAPALAFGDGPATFERDSQFVSSLGDTAGLPEDLELRFGESLKDMTHLPSASVVDIGQPDASLPIAIEQPDRVLDKFSLGLVEKTLDMEFSAVSKTVYKPSFAPLQHELEEIIENIGISSDKIKTRKPSKKYKYRVRPIMTSEEYSKFLKRRKAFMDPVIYYAKINKKLSDKKQEEEFIGHEFEDPIIRDLLKLAVKEIPVPVIPTYLRDQPLIEREPGKIPLFEFPLLEKDYQHQEAIQEIRTDDNRVTVDLEGPSNLMPLTDFHSRDAVRPASEIDEIQNLSSLMMGLSLDFTPRISMLQPLEEAPMPPNLEHVKETSFPQTGDENGKKRIYTHSVQESLDELFIKITDLFTEKDATVITFLDICDLSKTKLQAATVFIQLIELWKHKLIYLHQASSHPSDIFISTSH